METDLPSPVMSAPAVKDVPSADFIRAVSDLLRTDPTDLLAELGYYDRKRRIQGKPLGKITGVK